MGSSSGYQDLEVQSNTRHGAIEQFERIYGAEQVINVRESSSGIGGSFDAMGSIMLLGAILVFGLIIAYWQWFLFGGIIIGILWWFGKD